MRGLGGQKHITILALALLSFGLGAGVAGAAEPSALPGRSTAEGAEHRRASAGRSIAFHYGAHPPLRELALFERVVVEPGHLSADEVAALSAKAELYGYLSVGEIARTSSAHASSEGSWFLGHNAAWESDVLDPRVPAVRAHLHARVEALWARGYRALFLDTLDSYRGAVPEGAEQEEVREALVTLVRELHERNPGLKLLFNRGFELLPDLAPVCSGVVAESLFRGFDAASGRYVRVPEEDRRWLLDRLREVSARYGLEALAIDYVPPHEDVLARETAERIRALGITPYVTDFALGGLGVSTRYVVPRVVLAVYDTERPERSAIHRHLALPLEHLGYTLEYRSAHASLPEPSGRHAAVVSWLEGAPPPGWEGWLTRQREAGLALVLLGAPGLKPDGALARSLGFASSGALSAERRIVRADGLVDFEAAPTPRRWSPLPYRAVHAALDRHLELMDDAGNRATAIATGPFGALGLGDYLLTPELGGGRRWLVDPFSLLERALRPSFPAPDVTTESGRRLLTIEVDGAGAASPSIRPGRPTAGEVVLEQLLERHALPFSLAGLEVSPDGAARASLRERLATLAHHDDADAGAVQVTGGLRLSSLDRPSLSELSPLEPPRSPGSVAATVYSPLVNAETFAALGRIAPYRYDVLKGLLERTEAPRRLKPAALFYTLGSGATPGATDAISRLYAWAEERPLHPIPTSRYAAKVKQLREVAIARTLDGRWIVDGLSEVRTLRLPAALGRAEPRRSSGLVSERAHEGARYFGFDGRERVELAVTGGSPAQETADASGGSSEEPREVPLLREANARVVSWGWAGHMLTFRLVGAVPVRAVVEGLPPGCEVAPRSRGEGFRADRRGATLSLSFEGRDSGELRFACP